MTTLENTISILGGLPETDLNKILVLVKKLFQRHEDRTADEAVGQFLKPMSREDFMRDIGNAGDAFARGNTRRWEKRLMKFTRNSKICKR